MTLRSHTLYCVSVSGPTAVIPQYYGVHWGVYPANIIQQSGPSGQARRPLSPSQPSEVTSQSNGNLAASAAAAAAGNMQGPLSQYQVLILEFVSWCAFRNTLLSHHDFLKARDD